ncbi:MAG: hypothetical protein JW934_15180 [Anaerolineae bacterium]|nr:hypothetical protein [Anaerolineae bacterium]
MSIRAEIKGGACGFVTTVETTCEDGQHVVLQVHSDCPLVGKLAAALSEVDAFQEVLRAPLKDTRVAQLADEFKLHTACIVPVGLLKAIEAAAGLALSAESGVVLTRIE